MNTSNAPAEIRTRVSTDNQPKRYVRIYKGSLYYFVVQSEWDKAIFMHKLKKKEKSAQEILEEC